MTDPCKGVDCADLAKQIAALELTIAQLNQQIAGLEKAREAVRITLQQVSALYAQCCP